MSRISLCSLTRWRCAFNSSVFFRLCFSTAVSFGLS
jgi:hypothetical protein